MDYNNSPKRGRLNLSSILLVFILSFMTSPDTVTVSWSANTESDLAGYRIYYGAFSGKYDNEIDVGNVTSFVIRDIEDGTTYFFALTAYDDSSNESGFSDEVMSPDNRPPCIWDIVFVDRGNKHQEDVVLEIIAHDDETQDDNGWTIWGHSNRDPPDAGIFILNPEKLNIRVSFDAKIIGRGSCLDEPKLIRIESSFFEIGVSWQRVEFTSSAENIFINFFDDCWIPGESDANLRIENIEIF